MNEYKKQIIELIKDYMDKTLSMGCITKRYNKWYIVSWEAYNTIIDSKIIIETWNGFNKETYNFNQNLRDNEEWDKLLPDWRLQTNRRKYSIIYEYEYPWVLKYSTEKDSLWTILWHYDITAVLKYIENKISEYEKYYTIANWFLWFSFSNKEWETIKIPNKPLHLYTEEEDKNLLSLLQKLW